MNKKCMECGEPILGRIDKKYCSDLCRNSFNNKTNSANSDFVRTVNSMLRRNRKILKELLPAEAARTTKTKLLKKGFNFHYHTSTKRTAKGVDYFFCYEYGYSPLEKGYYYIFKQEEE